LFDNKSEHKIALKQLPVPMTQDKKWH